MCGRYLCWCVLLFTWSAWSAGVRLYPCGDAGFQDVEENTPLTFYCDQYTGSVDWRFKPVNGSVSSISVCSSTCTASPFPAWRVRAISSTNSSLTTSLTARNPAQSGAHYLCDNEQCELHVFVPAVVSQPTSPVINRQDSGYTLSASVNVTQVYSSMGNYSCLWQLGPSRQNTTPDLSPPAANTSNTADRTGRCNVTMSLPDTSGTYPCNVTVTPGNTQTSCGSLTITRPSPPTISCPSDFIAENTSLTCTCNTANIGQPGGRLGWFTGTGSDISTEVISGAYDVSTLDMTWTVRLGDHGNRKFRCVNNWTVNVAAQSDYTARVAYPPTNTILTVNYKTNITVNETEAVTLTCESRGGPAPRLKLLQRNVQLARQDGGQLSLSEEIADLSHHTAARCSNTGTFTCRADNGVGSVQNVYAQLYVNCKPRQTTAAPAPPKVTFINKAVSTAFYLQAFPLPDSFTVQYRGTTQNCVSRQPVPDSINVTARCINTFAAFAVQCNVSVNSAKDSTAEGFYTFTAANAFGQEHFVFQVTVNASTSSPSQSLGTAAAAAVGLAVVVVVLVVLVLVLIFFLRRRHCSLPCAAAAAATTTTEGGVLGNESKRSPKAESRAEPQSGCPVSDVYEMMEDGSPRHTTEEQPSSVYTCMQTSEIGVPSVYSQLTAHHTVAAAPLPQDPVYENSEAGKTTVYENLPDQP